MTASPAFTICKPVLSVLASVFGAVLGLVSTLAQAQPHVEGELNRAKAALQLKTRAASVFARCAQMGDAPCQLQLGWHYEEGKGVPQSLAEAVKWYRAAADQQDPRAAENLGNMYHLGRGVKKNCKVAVEWYARGALQQ